MAEDVIAVAHAGDVSTARQAAQVLANAAGFDETARAEITMVVSELAVNLVTHAHGGHLRLRSLDAEGRRGVHIEAHDSGPGIADVERALMDGFSTAGSLGYGLGTVLRLTDTCDITSHPGQGTHIVAQRWLRPATRGTAPYPLDFGVATRPRHGEAVNGDAFVLKRWEEHALVGVIDGLGHGAFAHQAAETARYFVESHYDRPLEELFRGVARVCRPTRGVVMALARFEVSSPPAGAIRLSFASIGNVEARVVHRAEPINFQIGRGVLGGVAPEPRRTEHAWDQRGMLVLHSDGVTTRWRWEDFPDLTTQPATLRARRLLQALAKEEDDATVLVIKGLDG
jgi:anti-sigma regulatory factor (Ser/Thr protein kinase)/serine/threonine protein phosphatase PrpC